MQNGISRIFGGFTNFFDPIQTEGPDPLPPSGRILVFEKNEGTLFVGSDGLAMVTMTWNATFQGGIYAVQAGRGDRLEGSFSTPNGLLEFLQKHEENSLRYFGQINLGKSESLAKRIPTGLAPRALWAFRSRRKIEIGFGDDTAEVIGAVGIRIENFRPFYLPFILFQKLSGFFTALDIEVVDLFLKLGEEDGPWSPPIVLLSGTDSNGNRARVLTGGTFFSDESLPAQWWR